MSIMKAYVASRLRSGLEENFLYSVSRASPRLSELVLGSTSISRVFRCSIAVRFEFTLRVKRWHVLGCRRRGKDTKQPLRRLSLPNWVCLRMILMLSTVIQIPPHTGWAHMRAVAHR